MNKIQKFGEEKNILLEKIENNDTKEEIKELKNEILKFEEENAV